MSSPLFRLQGIPVSLSKAEIRAHITNDPSIRLLIPEKSIEVHIFSLAHSPGNTSENTATWAFAGIQVDSNQMNGKIIQCSCAVCNPDEMSVGPLMVIDAEFDGLTSLHSPAEYDMGWEME